jgi:hypothetical protein
MSVAEFWDRKYRPKLTLKEVEKMLAKELKLKKDWAAEIANAVFVGNREQIYEAFSRQVNKGESSAFNALASRAYGLPRQEMSFSQDKPFKLVVEYIGERQPETITIEGERLPPPKMLAKPPEEEREIAEDCSD